jgi:hypothetical protein
MSKDTDYKRLWRDAKKQVLDLVGKMRMLEEVNKVQVDVLRRVRDGELKPEKIFEDENFTMAQKLSSDVKLPENGEI